MNPLHPINDGIENMEHYFRALRSLLHKETKSSHVCRQYIAPKWFQKFEQRRATTNHSLWPRQITI